MNQSEMTTAEKLIAKNIRMLLPEGYGVVVGKPPLDPELPRIQITVIGFTSDNEQKTVVETVSEPEALKQDTVASFSRFIAGRVRAKLGLSPLGGGTRAGE